MTYAQQKTETLLGELSFSSIGSMVEPGLQFTQVAGEAAVFYNFRAGISFNDKWTVGGFYSHLLADIQPEMNMPLLDSYQVGGFIEYTPWSSSLVHLSFPLSVGVMELDTYSLTSPYDSSETHSLLLEPRALAEVNLHRYVRLNAGMGYRIMGRPFQEVAAVPEAGNALTFQIGLKLGLFNRADQ
jgi:hypothetical protein